MVFLTCLSEMAEESINLKQQLDDIYKPSFAKVYRYTQLHFASRYWYKEICAFLCAKDSEVDQQVRERDGE